MAEKEKKKPKTVDDILGEIHEKPDIDKSFESYDKHTDEDKLIKHFNDMFAPAQDELYTGVKEQLEKDFKEDTEKLEGKKEHIQRAIVAGLKKYFERVSPAILEALDEGWDIEHQYKWLTSMYDDHIGARAEKGEGLSILAEVIPKDKKLTVGHLKKIVYTNKAKHAQGAVNEIEQKARRYFIERHPKHEIAKYMKKEAEKAGFEPEDTVDFLTRPLDKHLEMRDFLRGKGEKGYEAHGLKKKEEKKYRAAA